MKAKKDRNREIDKSGMTQEVKDQLGHIGGNNSQRRTEQESSV